MTRDLLVDLQKGLQAAGGGSVAEKRARKLRRNEIKIVSISFIGRGCFDNLTLATSEHIAHFYDAAEWFVKHQDLNTGKFPGLKNSQIKLILSHCRWLAESS